MNKIASLIIIWMVIVSTSCTGKQSSPDDSKTDNTNDANNTTAIVQTLSSENWIALFTLIASQLYINIPVDDIKTAFSTFEKVTEDSFMGSEIAGSSFCNKLFTSSRGHSRHCNYYRINSFHINW